MELIVSAVAGDLVNRFISFMINKYRSEENLAEKTERLQDLLIRVHMIVEEADVRYITNSKEKQEIINTLLQENLPPFAPTVLPIIGGSRVDVDDKIWQKFYSSAKQMGAGSKILILSRIAKLSRFGTVKPVHLNSLSVEEYSYLFKVLAFGSTNPEDHPQLAAVAKDLAASLGGSLVTANVYADTLRRNQNVHFWTNILKRYRNVIQKNFLVFGEHPKNLMDKDHPVDITKLVSLSSSLPSSTTVRLMPPHSEIDYSKKKLPKVMFGDIIAGRAILPEEEFELVAWESRIPPYKRFVNLATYYDVDMASQNNTESPNNKRQRLDK
ncbi:hypothetical protein EJB05_23065, partial [Eragrostis curvula]